MTVSSQTQKLLLLFSETLSSLKSVRGDFPNIFLFKPFVV